MLISQLKDSAVKWVLFSSPKTMHFLSLDKNFLGEGMRSQGVFLLVSILPNCHDLLNQWVVEIRCDSISPQFYCVLRSLDWHRWWTECPLSEAGPAGEPQTPDTAEQHFRHLTLPLKAKGSIVWWPHQAKEPTLPTVLKVICVHFDLPGLANPSNCSPSHQVNRKQTKFIPDKQFQQTSSLHIHWASAKGITWDQQLINLSAIICSFILGEPYEKSWSKTTCRAPVLSSHPLR